MHYTFQFGVVLAHWPAYVRGAFLSLELALLGFWCGAAFGLVLAAFRTFGNAWVRRLAGGYVTFVTNTPILIHIYFLYYGLPEVGILLSAFNSVLLALTMAASAYTCEIMRAGFISVRRNEMEAAEVLGFSLAQQIWYVIVPHIAKTIYPALANFFIILVLSTSMAMIVGLNELTGTAYNLASENYRHIESFTVAAGFYVLITFICSLSLALVGRWAFRVKAKIF